MKIDRRSFLSLGVGLGAGITLSPLPWKLTDDSSIWSQMWPWTPVPEDGEYRYVNSVCTLCPGGCGISVRKVDERAVKIEGMKGHPVNNGGICLLGLSGLQLLYGPYRVTSPLKRRETAKRGEGQWEKISWDQAIAEVAKKLGDAKDKAACISDSDKGTVAQLFKRLLAAAGSANFIRTPSVQDSYQKAIQNIHGVTAMTGFDFENADFILSFGAGLLDGWGSPVRMFKANAIWKDKKIPVIQVEPRLSNSAAKSDKWIPITPGTESELALGIAHVILKEGLAKVKPDDSFVKVLENYTPEKVSQTTAIDPKVITELAKSFAAASKPLALCGRGKGATPVSMHEAIAVHAMNVMMGNVNTEGGVYTVPEPDYIRWNKVDVSGTPMALNQIVSEKSPIQALLISNANPLFTMSDTQTVKKAFEKIPFIASFSSYMDETAQFADLILPNHCYLERYEDVPAPAGFHKPVIGLTRPVVKPLFKTKHSGDVVIAIAKEMGAESSFPWENYEACLKETLGDAWEALEKDGVLVGEFAAPSVSAKLAYEDNALKPISAEGDEKAFPLTLISYDSMRLAGNSIGQPPFILKTLEDTALKKNDICVEINPQTAKSIGISDCGYSVLSTPKGSAKVRVCLSEGIMPGVVAMPKGLGHTRGFNGNDKYLADKGVNFCELIGPAEDPASGLDTAWGIRAKLAKA